MIEEPIMKAEIMIPKEFVGNVMDVCQNRRGTYLDMKYLDENRVTVEYDLPLNEIIYDFFDTIKSKTKGYASVDYEFKEYRKADLIRLDLYINNEQVDALSFIVHKDSAYSRGRKMAEKLSAVFSAISLGRISKIKQISYMVNGQSLELKNRPYC